ncbi:MAG: alpha/beta hydrolase [Bifidobacteriaceae bacterium]|jgi:pimeloyl-ACP methyl ester carboxylesterase|nr:alpha/beta hydrolase [Bifidobacteriaceae bacterium]
MDDYQFFDLADGTRLAYVDRGSGPPVLLLAGWSQTVELYKNQIDVFAQHHRVIALDWRGHGRSTGDWGYRTGRLARDLSDFIEGLGLAKVDVVAHSVGASLVWAYIEAYGEHRLRRAVFVDQASSVMAKPDWDRERRIQAGCSLPDPSGLVEFYNQVISANTVEDSAEVIRRLFSPSISEAELRWAAEENLTMPREAAAALLWDTALNDYSDLFARVSIPVLVIGFERSLFPAASQTWIAEQIPAGQARIFSIAEGASHFMFLESPEPFNEAVLAFLGT